MRNEGKETKSFTLRKNKIMKVHNCNQSVLFIAFITSTMLTLPHPGLVDLALGQVRTVSSQFSQSHTIVTLVGRAQ
jgi:hypothetical protein